MCAPLCCKSLCLASRFCTGGRGVGEQIQKFARRGHEANASPRTQPEPEAPGPSLGLGHQQHPKPENRDSQHTLNQHRGSFLRSEKLQNESSPNFSNFRPEFCPEFCSEFSPNFLRSFRASFRGKLRPEKIHQQSPPFSMQNSQANTEKKTHKIFLESGQSNFFRLKFGNPPFTFSQSKTKLCRGDCVEGPQCFGEPCKGGVSQRLFPVLPFLGCLDFLGKF